MKIVFVTRGPYGLLGSNASYMFPSLLSEKADVTVIAPKASRGDRIVFHDDRVKVIEISNGRVLQRAEEAAAHIEAIDPDIVHVFGHPRCFLFPMLSRRLQSRQRAWLVDIRTHIFGLSGIGLKLEKSLNTYLQRYVDHICHTAEASMYTVLYRPTRPVSWLPIGINLASFPEPVERSSTLPTMRFACVGSIARARKLDVLVKNFGAFATQSEVPAVLEIYGDGNAVSDLSELIASHDWSNFIQLKGLVAASEVGEILQQCDAGFVHLPKDKFNKAPALKRIEYAASGVRIIESDTDYHRENPEGFRTTLVPDDTETFVRVMNEFVAHQPNFDDLIHNRERAARFDWNYIVENDLMPIYDRLLSTVVDGASGTPPEAQSGTEAA